MDKYGSYDSIILDIHEDNDCYGDIDGKMRGFCRIFIPWDEQAIEIQGLFVWVRDSCEMVHWHVPNKHSDHFYPLVN